MKDEFFTLQELSKHLKLSTDTIYRMVWRGEIPSVKIGKKWRFKKSRIDEWIAQKEIGGIKHKKNRTKKCQRKK